MQALAACSLLLLGSAVSGALSQQLVSTVGVNDPGDLNTSSKLRACLRVTGYWAAVARGVLGVDWAGWPCCSYHGLAASPHPDTTQVNELKQEIYTPLPLGPGHAGDACVRLLHAAGTVGCAAPTGRQPTQGPLVRLESLRQPDEYTGTSWSHPHHAAIHWADFLCRLPVLSAPALSGGLPPFSPRPASADNAVYLLSPALLADFLLQCRDSPSLAGRVRGVLVEPGPSPGYSQAAAAPLAEFALYANRSYPWNPDGVAGHGKAQLACVMHMAG